MSNQVFSNDTHKYPIDGADINNGGSIIVNGNSLNNYLDQPVKMASSPTFNNVTTSVIQSSGFLILSPGNQIPVQLLPADAGLTDNLPRIIQKYFKATVIGTGGISIPINNLIQAAGTITIQVQFNSIAGSFVGQYGSYRQTTRYINNGGTITIGSNLENLLQRDTNVATAAISLSTSPNTINTIFTGVAGENLNVSGTVTIFQ